MSIPVQTVVSVMASRLDAEGSDRYLFDQDYKPAVNTAIRNITSVANSIFGDKKGYEENFRELQRTACFISSQFGRVNINTLTPPVWTILAVYPKITFTNPTFTPPVFTLPYESAQVTTTGFDEAVELPAKRLSVEEFRNSKGNPHSPGFTGAPLMAGSEEYAYLGPQKFGAYSGTSYPATLEEIEISPRVNREKVGIVYISVHPEIVLIGDNILFPAALLEMVVSFGLNAIAEKQGDGTTLYSVSNSDRQMLTNLLSQ